MNQTVQHRQVGPDYAKMLGIILVVWGHTIRGLMSAGILPEDSAFWINLDAAIYLFHMPLFFFLSGLFIQQSVAKTSLGDFFKRNLLIFILPLIFWSYTQSGLQYAASSSVNVERSLEYLLIAPFPPKQQFWFLWSLFLISCFSAAVLKLNKGKTILGGAAIAIVGILSLGERFGVDFITYKMAGQTFGEAFFFFPYFVMGLFLAAPALNEMRSRVWLYLLAFFAVIWAYLTLYQESNAYYYFFSFLCVYASYKTIACIGDWIEKRVTEKPRPDAWLSFLHRSFVFIGMNSFIIYLAHIIPEGGIRVVLMKLGVNDPTLHIIAGNLAGLSIPLLLVPINAYLVRYWKSAKYFFPVRRLKYE